MISTDISSSLIFLCFISIIVEIVLVSSFITKMPKLLIFDGFMLLSRDLRRSQTTHFYDVKFSVRFTHFSEDFGQKSVLGSKTVFLGHYYMVFPAGTNWKAFSQQI